MFTLSLLTLGIAILLAAITIFSVVATQNPTLQPAVVNPFAPVLDPAAETLPTTDACEHTLVSDWQSAEFRKLCNAEVFLDSLEAQQVTNTKLEFTAADRFTVRWR